MSIRTRYDKHQTVQKVHILILHTLKKVCMSSATVNHQLVCFHCGEICTTTSILAGEKHFCCEGCKMVYQLLNQSGLCDYYTLNQMPGTNQREPVRNNKFAFLEDPLIARQLITYSDGQQTNVTFLPSLVSPR